MSLKNVTVIPPVTAGTVTATGYSTPVNLADYTGEIGIAVSATLTGVGSPTYVPIIETGGMVKTSALVSAGSWGDFEAVDNGTFFGVAVGSTGTNQFRTYNLSNWSGGVRVLHKVGGTSNAKVSVDAVVEKIQV
jgi:hypothetical protein